MVAVLGLAAVLMAAPASADDHSGVADVDEIPDQGDISDLLQDEGGLVAGRTGNLHDDCQRFSLQETDHDMQLRAWCRVSDFSYDRERTSIDLTVGSDDWGVLHCHRGHFQQYCFDVQLEADYSRVVLKAECVYQPSENCNEEVWPIECSRTAALATSLDLNECYQVSTEGALEFR